MFAHIRIKRLLTLIVALLLGIVVTGARPVAAAGQATDPDQVALQGIAADAGVAQGSDGTLRFTVPVQYRLQTAPSGFLQLFVFENGSDTSSQDSAQRYGVVSGSGQAILDITYRPHPGVQQLTVFAGLFKDKNTLLAWTATKPVALAAWLARPAFGNAITARQAGDYVKAVEDLSIAIGLQPQVGNLYNWRADSYIHLGQFDSAVADYSRALDLLPQDRSSRLGRGIALLWLGSWQAAIDDLTRVINDGAAPDHFSAWAFRGRGVAYAALNQRARAVVDYQTYLALTPDAPDRAQVEGWITDLAANATPGGAG